MTINKRYYPYSEYLKKHFGQKVYKITVDAGFSCPNRDGTISSDGCIFCDEAGSFSCAHDAALDIKNQIKLSIQNIEEKRKAEKFIVYFQAFTNTYKPCDELKRIYDASFCDERIVGISIGTRPDCVDEEKLSLISKYPFPQIEYGLQSIHNETLKLINRGHDYEAFEKAYFMTKEKGIKVCVHIILGLPNETRDMMMETARKLGELEVDGVKIHCLTILKGSKLEKNYKDKVRLLSEEEYSELVCDFMEYLSPKTAIHRLSGSGLRSETIEPKWINHKFHTQNLIDRILWERNSHQGIKFKK